MTASLSETFAPPRMTTYGLSGLPVSFERTSTSLAMSQPA